LIQTGNTKSKTDHEERTQEIGEEKASKLQTTKSRGRENNTLDAA